MNLTFQGAFATMPPRLYMNKVDVDIIRPLCLVPEADIVEYAKLRELKKQIKNCPYEQDSNRHDMQKVMDLLEKMNPEARHSLWGAMTNIQSDYLPILKDE
jgi:tRNA(Ile)-lysidine synthase TilS/MesJ